MVPSVAKVIAHSKRVCINDYCSKGFGAYVHGMNTRGQQVKQVVNGMGFVSNDGLSLRLSFS